MKLLFDQNISFRVPKKLKNIFPLCKHLSNCELMDCEDSEIWEYALKNEYSIVTFDSDFYDISLINGHPPKIIWLRTGNITTEQIVELFKKHQYSIENFLTGKESEDLSCMEID